MDREIIDQLDIPAGLKELLIRHGFTIEELEKMKSSDLAETLNIDEDVARLIAAAVKKYTEDMQRE